MWLLLEEFRTPVKNRHIFYFGGGQASTPQVPTPVEKFPGLQNLGTQLVNMLLLPILQGQAGMQGGLAQRPYKGWSSVYGGPGGTFPGAYSVLNSPNPALNGARGGFQNTVNALISSIIGQGLNGGGGSAARSGAVLTSSEQPGPFGAPQPEHGEGAGSVTAEGGALSSNGESRGESEAEHG